MTTSIYKKVLAVCLTGLLLAGCTSPALEGQSPKVATASTVELVALSGEETVAENQIPTLDGAGLGILDPTPNSLQPLLTPLPYDVEDLLTPVESLDESSPLPGTRDEPIRTTPSPSMAKVSLTNPTPIYDAAFKTGKKFRAAVNAPSGSKVTATVNGKSYSLTETGATSGIGSFRGDYTVPTVSGTVDFGKVVYSMTYKGNTTQKVSEGSLFAVGPNDTLRIQIKSNSATAFRDPRTRVSGNYTATLRKGAVDSVTDFYGNMYRLATVGWIDASSAQPLTSEVSLNNKLSSVNYSSTSEGELLVLTGTSNPPYKVSRSADALILTFYRTSGVSEISLEASSLFSSAKVTETDGSMAITFNESDPGQLWGYLVEYSSGTTQVLFVKKPKVVDTERPLTGMTIVVDPGHGGKDTGALGFGANGHGLVEKQINLATALVLKEQLEAKGATVIMTREGDSTVELSERLDITQQTRADFMISLHCNSSSNSNGQGVEVYYYDTNSRSLASNISATVSDQTQRTNRGAKHSCYVVTLSSHAPSVLVEMGFMTNKAEYNNLQEQTNIENTAKSITASIITAVE